MWAAVARESFLDSLPFDQSLEKGVRDGQEGEGGGGPHNRQWFKWALHLLGPTR